MSNTDLQALVAELIASRREHRPPSDDAGKAMSRLTTVEHTYAIARLADDFLEQFMGSPVHGATWPTTEKRHDFGFRSVCGPHRMPMIDGVISRLASIVAPRRVADLGCGTGLWLKSSLAHGAAEVLGLDAHPADDGLQIPATSYRQVELRQPLDLGETFDLVQCFWLGECIEAKYARALVQNCAALAPVVCFVSATPLTSGPRPWFHEQWPSYWAEMFRDEGYVAFNTLREQLWSVPEVPGAFAQSLVLYVRRDHVAKVPGLAGLAPTEDLGLLDVVHPKEYLGACHVIINSQG